MKQEIEVIFKDKVDFCNRFMKYLIDLLVESNYLLGEKCGEDSNGTGANKKNDK